MRRTQSNGKKLTYRSRMKKPAKKVSKPKSLNDFLKKGMRPPTKGKKAPPDYDVVTPDMGYTKPTKKSQPKKIKKK
jgi:hypothetical protein